MKTIMLVCAAGMSTSLLVTKMEKAAAEKGLDAKIFAVAASEAETKIANEKIDVLLLGPQVRYMQNDFKKKLAGRNNGADIPLAVIDMRAYGMMDGAAVVTQAYELMGK